MAGLLLPRHGDFPGYAAAHAAPSEFSIAREVVITIPEPVKPSQTIYSPRPYGPIPGRITVTCALRFRFPSLRPSFQAFCRTTYAAADTSNSP